MIHIAVCDDKTEWLEALQSQIEEILAQEDYRLSLFNQADALLEALSTDTVDILITDIQMPQMDGIHMAKEVYKRSLQTQIIFVSAFTDFIEDVFAVEPVYYLVKPVQKEKLHEALSLACKKLDKSRDTVSIVSKNRALRIPLADIEYIASDKHTVTFYGKNRTESCTAKLDEIEAQLPQSFIRCHKSFLVNMNCIQRISNNRFELFSGKSVPIAKSRYTAVKAAVLQFWGEQL